MHGGRAHRVGETVHDRAVAQHVAERGQTVLAVIDQRAAEMAALRHVDALDRGGIGGPARAVRGSSGCRATRRSRADRRSNLPARARRSAQSSARASRCAAQASRPARGRPARRRRSSHRNRMLDRWRGGLEGSPPMGEAWFIASQLPVCASRPRLRHSCISASISSASTGTSRGISSQPVGGDDRVVLDADADVPVTARARPRPAERRCPARW